MEKEAIGLLLKDDKIYDNFEKSTRELASFEKILKGIQVGMLIFQLLVGGKPYVDQKSK